MTNPTVQLIIDAEQGKLAIVKPTNVNGVASISSALEKLNNPYNYLSYIKFHSDFSYFRVNFLSSVNLTLPNFFSIASGTQTLATIEALNYSNYTNPGVILNISNKYLFNNYMVYSTSSGYIFIFSSIRQTSGKWYIDIKYYYNIWQTNSSMSTISIPSVGVYIYER